MLLKVLLQCWGKARIWRASRRASGGYYPPLAIHGPQKPPFATIWSQAACSLGPRSGAYTVARSASRRARRRARWARSALQVSFCRVSNPTRDYACPHLKHTVVWNTGVEQCGCPATQYKDPDGACQSCPSGATCVDETTPATLNLTAGRWRTNASSVVIETCAYAAHREARKRRRRRPGLGPSSAARVFENDARSGPSGMP